MFKYSALNLSISGCRGIYPLSVDFEINNDGLTASLRLHPSHKVLGVLFVRLRDPLAPQAPRGIEQRIIGVVLGFDEDPDFLSHIRGGFEVCSPISEGVFRVLNGVCERFEWIFGLLVVIGRRGRRPRGL